MIEPIQTIELRSVVGGAIEKITVRRGDRVTKGQVLVTLESSAERAAAESATYRAQMEGPEAVAQTKLEYAERTYARHREMAAQNLMSGQDKDDAERDVRSAEAELVLARENREMATLDARQQTSMLERRTIRSPFNGVVADQLLYPGEVIEPGDSNRPILKLAQIDPLRVHVILPFTVFGRVKPGAVLEVIPELPVGRKLEGTVAIVDSVLDAASGTFAVFLELPNPQLDLPAGLKCRAVLPAP
ncbi:MAG TPA: efflux RND transporter periplasmic adaptor subunit [Gammaproteobacteria bacterium]|nr:efflux RND transporter periplasmic adaptor subunit [Gammaproteobacteria bacterium]